MIPLLRETNHTIPSTLTITDSNSNNFSTLLDFPRKLGTVVYLMIFFVALS